MESYPSWIVSGLVWGRFLVLFGECLEVSMTRRGDALIGSARAVHSLQAKRLTSLSVEWVLVTRLGLCAENGAIVISLNHCTVAHRNRRKVKMVSRCSAIQRKTADRFRSASNSLTVILAGPKATLATTTRSVLEPCPCFLYKSFFFQDKLLDRQLQSSKSGKNKSRICIG